MNLSDKIKALVKEKKRHNKDLMGCLSVKSTQALSNKYARNTFTAEELVKIADFLGVELAFLDGDKTIAITLEDVQKPAD